MSLARLPAIAAPLAVTAAQMAKADTRAIDDLGIAQAALMESAAFQTARAARAMLGDVAGARIVALVGPGNNGGDALAAARRLAGWGARTSALVAAAHLRGPAAAQAAAARSAGVDVATWDGGALPAADLLIDGLLGTSARGAARGTIADLIGAANATGTAILALDLPSGLDPDSGGAPGPVIEARCTVTLALPKAGLLVPAARRYVGELLLADIGIPPVAFAPLAIDPAALFGAGSLVRILLP